MCPKRLSEALLNPWSIYLLHLDDVTILFLMTGDNCEAGSVLASHWPQPRQSGSEFKSGHIFQVLKLMMNLITMNLPFKSFSLNPSDKHFVMSQQNSQNCWFLVVVLAGACWPGGRGWCSQGRLASSSKNSLRSWASSPAPASGLAWVAGWGPFSPLCTSVAPGWGWGGGGAIC